MRACKNSLLIAFRNLLRRQPQPNRFPVRLSRNQLRLNRQQFLRRLQSEKLSVPKTIIPCAVLTIKLIPMPVMPKLPESEWLMPENAEQQQQFAPMNISRYAAETEKHIPMNVWPKRPELQLNTSVFVPSHLRHIRITRIKDNSALRNCPSASMRRGSFRFA